MLGDEHIDAFLIGLGKTPGVCEPGEALFHRTNTQMMDAHTGTEDKKYTGEHGQERKKQSQE